MCAQYIKSYSINNIHGVGVKPQFIKGHFMNGHSELVCFKTIQQQQLQITYELCNVTNGVHSDVS